MEREAPAPELAPQRANPWVVAASARVDADGRYVEAAERIAEGWLDMLRAARRQLGTPPRWNRDPKTGIEAPLAFGKLLDYRDRDRGRRHQVPVGAQPPPAPGDAGAGLER